jgi:hypothetical protein
VPHPSKEEKNIFIARKFIGPTREKEGAYFGLGR